MTDLADTLKISGDVQKFCFENVLIYTWAWHKEFRLDFLRMELLIIMPLALWATEKD